MAKTIVDVMTAEEYETYTAILERAEAARKAAPKEKVKRAPKTLEQKAADAKKRYEALEAKVQTMLAAQASMEDHTDATTPDGE